MSNVNVDIDPARVAVDLLWPPQLTIDMFAQQWARFTQPSDLHLGSIQNVGATGGWGDWFDVVVCYPDTWDLDTTFDERMRLRLELTFNGVGGGAPPPQVRFKPSADADTPAVLLPGSPRLVHKDYHRNLPTGPTRETVQIEQLGAGTATLTREWGAIGPDCCYRFVIVES